MEKVAISSWRWIMRTSDRVRDITPLCQRLSSRVITRFALVRTISRIEDNEVISAAIINMCAMHLACEKRGIDG